MSDDYILLVDDDTSYTLTVSDDTAQEMTVAESIVIGSGGNLQSKSVSYTPSTSAQSDTVQPDVGYDGLSQVDVSVSAVQAGTEGTPVATKGAVSNHAIAVTPSVTNTEGYISGGTKTGTPVSVAASELVSGKKEITSNGDNIDVTNYEKVKVAVPGSSPTLQNKTVYPASSDQSITADNGYDGLGTVTAKAVVLSNLIAGNIKDGVTVTVGDVDDADRITSVTGTYSGGGGATYTSGTYTPTQDILNVSFDIGDSSLTHFFLWAGSSPYGHSKRVSLLAFRDFAENDAFMITSNSSGASAAASWNLNGDAGITKNGSTVSFSSSGSSASAFNYFISGVTYNWIAW